MRASAMAVRQISGRPADPNRLPNCRPCGATVLGHALANGQTSGI